MGIIYNKNSHFLKCIYKNKVNNVTFEMEVAL